MPGSILGLEDTQIQGMKKVKSKEAIKMYQTGMGLHRKGLSLGSKDGEV